MPFDIESRGRARIRQDNSLRPRWWQLGLAGLSAAEATRRGFANIRKYSAPPSPPSTPGKRMRTRSVSMGSRSRSSSRGRTSYRSPRRSRSRTRSSSIISRQHDQRGTYQSRGRASSGSRRYRRFRYRVMNALLNEQPLQIYTTKKSQQFTSAVDQQSFWGVGLYQTSYTGQTDLLSIATDAGITTGTAAQQGMRVIIKGAVLDVELKNNGSSDIIMDVYELLNVKDVNTTNAIDTQWSTFYAQQGTITAASAVDPAVSVFENGAFCQHYKVLRKREVLLPAGEIITMQMRLSKDRRIQVDSILNYTNAIPKLAKYYWFMWHGPPDPTAGGGGTPALAATSVTISYQKSYKYGVPPTPKAQPQVHNVP